LLLWGIFDRESLDSLAGQLMPLKNRRPVLKCRESDATAMKVTKGSRLRRLSDDSVYVVRDLAPDGTAE
jgi:hypothetical protein